MAANPAQLIEREVEMRRAPEPGGMEGISMGDDGVEVKKTSVKSAGYIVMWNTDTFEPSRFNMNGVRAKLGEVFPPDHPRRAGLPAWTSFDPKKTPWRGTATCPLHASQPERTHYDTLGYPECSRIQLPNAMEAREHLRKKHPATFRQMNEDKADMDRKAQEEDRNINRRILAKLAGVDLDEPVPAEIVVPSVWMDLSTEVGGTAADVDPEAPAAWIDPVPPVPAKANAFFRCTKCKANHQKASKFGRRHWKHREA